MSEKVTKEQYEFFRSLYEDEQKTSEKLEGRAKVYLGIVSAFLAAIIVKADEARKIADTLHLRWAFLLADAIPVTVALFLVLWSLRVHRFEAVNDGPDLVTLYSDEWPSEEQFFGDRIVDYAFASSVNRKSNNKTAAQLTHAGLWIGGAILYLFAIVVYAIWRA